MFLKDLKVCNSALIAVIRAPFRALIIGCLWLRLVPGGSGGALVVRASLGVSVGLGAAARSRARFVLGAAGAAAPPRLHGLIVRLLRLRAPPLPRGPVTVRLLLGGAGPAGAAGLAAGLVPVIRVAVGNDAFAVLLLPVLRVAVAVSSVPAGKNGIKRCSL